MACSQAALALSPQANQGISSNDYNQPHYPESCRGPRQGKNTVFFHL